MLREIERGVVSPCALPYLEFVREDLDLLKVRRALQHQQQLLREFAKPGREREGA